MSDRYFCRQGFDFAGSITRPLWYSDAMEDAEIVPDNPITIDLAHVQADICDYIFVGLKSKVRSAMHCVHAVHVTLVSAWRRVFQSGVVVLGEKLFCRTFLRMSFTQHGAQS